MLADFYWLQFMQYVGDNDARAADKYEKADQYVELITSLDPNFESAYYFAAFLIGSELHRPQAAEKILQGGIYANPGSWALPFLAGVNAYLYGHDERRAARFYRIAAALPGAPNWLYRQSVLLEENIPSVFKQINLWTSIYSSSKNSRMRETAKAKLIELWSGIYDSVKSPEMQAKARRELKLLSSS